MESCGHSRVVCLHRIDIETFGAYGPDECGVYMKNSQNGLIRLIAMFKLLKASLLIAVGVGAVKLIHNGGDGTLEHWVTILGLIPGSSVTLAPPMSAGSGA
jgi:Predicted membrane protein (DUF2127)